jgi:hypothetical protein
MNKHTPGPWNAGISKIMRVATITTVSNRIPIAVTTGDAPKATHTANAILIAAAPELFDALRYLVALARDPDGCDYDADILLTEAEALIARVTK